MAVDQAPHRRRTGILRHADGAASIVGEVAMIAVAVLVIGTSGFLIFSAQDPPADVATTEFRAELRCGGTQWGDGDEFLQLSHIGGESLAGDVTRIVILVNGTSTTYAPGEVGGAFADGAFLIGESWRHTANITAGVPVEYQVYTQKDGVDQSVARRLVEDRRCGIELTPGVNPLPSTVVAYEDLDCDLMFDEGDLEVTRAQLEAGYTADDDTGDGIACLVIPTSTGPLTSGNIQIEATQDIIIEVDVTVTGGGEIHLCAAGDLNAPGITLTSEGDDIELAAGGTMDLTGAAIDSDLEVTLGTDVECSVVDSVTGVPQQILGAGSTMTAGGEHLTMDAYDFIDLTGATLYAHGSTSSEIPAAMSGSWAVAVQARSGAIEADGVTVGTAATSSTRSIGFYALGGELSLGSASIVSQGDGSTIDLRSNTGNVDVINSLVRIDTLGSILLDVDGGLTFALVQGATFDDQNDAGDVTPNGQFIGIPALGGLE